MLLLVATGGCFAGCVVSYLAVHHIPLSTFYNSRSEATPLTHRVLTRHARVQGREFLYLRMQFFGALLQRAE